MDHHRITVAEQLLDAVIDNDVAILRAILEQKGESSDGYILAATNYEIRLAFCRASECGSDEAILLLLFNKLIDQTKQKYYIGKNSNQDHDSPLHDAMRVGNVQVGEVLVNKCHFNPNQLNIYGKAPLFYAAQRCRKGNSLETCQFLLKNGANPNHGREGVFRSRPLYAAVQDGMTRIVGLLVVEHGVVPSVTDVSAAIGGGQVEILSILLKHGGSVGNGNDDNDNHDGDNETATTSLNKLLHSRDLTRSPAYNRETKLSICRLLVDHAKQGHEEEEDRDSIAFLQLTLQNEIIKARNNNDKGVAVLLEAGVDPFPVMNRAVQDGEESVCLLLIRHGVDPFLRRQGDGHIDDNGQATAPSPFLAAAYRQDRAGVLTAFLKHWDERFVSSGGKNSHGDHPIHFLSRDRHVSLQAIKLVVEYHANSTLEKRRGLFPFHLAAESDSSLDVIFYLVKHCPDAFVQPRSSTNSRNDSRDGNNENCDSVSRKDNYAPTAHTAHKQRTRQSRLEDHASCPPNKKSKLTVDKKTSIHQRDFAVVKSTGSSTLSAEGKSCRLALVVEAQEKKNKETAIECRGMLEGVSGELERLEQLARTAAAAAL